MVGGYEVELLGGWGLGGMLWGGVAYLGEVGHSGGDECVLFVYESVFSAGLV
jgi:hypothetical protein